jgi:hypothetical protein
MTKLSRRKWRILCWNVHGLNSENRQRDVRAKIEEGECDIVCLQETKCKKFDWRLIRKFCPKRFDSFAYSASSGASGGIIVLWNSSVFSGVLFEVKIFGLIINFTSVHNNAPWTLVTVYGPCHGLDRDMFVSWLYSLSIPANANWLIIGDFNFVRSQENRNKAGGDVNDMFLFNEIIGHLGLLELPLKGRAYTWSNMQRNPLLEQLDWFFTSCNWIVDYPNSLVLPLARKGSDHVPCVVTIDTDIPKAQIFWFESYWVDMPGFMECVSKSWSIESSKNYSSAIMADKLKKLRFELKKWHLSLAKLKGLMQNCNKVILILDALEEKKAVISC